jgi:3-oxoacyl-[acyl-carrier protein] reductase
VNYASDKAGAEGTVAEIEAKRGKAIAIKADMSQSTQVRQLFEETRKTLGIPSVLVNNAGVFEFGPIEEVTEANFHRHFNINVLGTMLAVQEAVKHFPAEGGSIVNISSIASESPVPNSSLYAASKGAIDTLTLALAQELGPRKIRVNAVAPGYTDTEGNQGFVSSAAGAAMVAATPLGARFGRPEEIAPAVIFLASDDAAWLTGERINASGGVH